MRVTVVGCAGSFPRADSAASCYLVEADDDEGRTWRVLLDLGSGALGPLQGHTDLRGVDAVLLSHLHADHCLDLCGLYVALRYDPRPPPPLGRVAVHGPTGTAARLSRAYGATDGTAGGEDRGHGKDRAGGEDGDDDLTTVFDVVEWSDGEAVAVGPLRVTPHRVHHPGEAYGLRVEHRTGHRGVVLAYTGDTDDCPALGPLAAGADLLLAEASFVSGRDSTRGVHLNGTQAGEVAARAGVGRLVLTHLPAWTDPRVVLEEARSTYPGPVDLAFPGQVLRL